MLQDRHTHTVFSDGKNTPEEMILAAIDRKMDRIGISDHAYTDFDDSFCMPQDCIFAYRDTIRALQEKYRDRIQIQLGLEQDFFSEKPRIETDYLIGSLHYVEEAGERLSVDWSPEIQRGIIETRFDGDFYAFAENYFGIMSHMYEKTGCDIIGHFDLVTVFTEEGIPYDPRNPRYRKAWQKAVDALTKNPGQIFEINTGAMSRGHRTLPYPSREMMDYIHEKGGRLEFTSDSHRTSTLLYSFEDLQKSGYVPADYMC